MSEKIHHYLLVFDHAQGKLIDEVREFERSEDAVQAYAAKEQEVLDGDEGLIEIVLIGSDSLETVMLTHANYFDGSVARPRSKYLVGI